MTNAFCLLVSAALLGQVDCPHGHCLHGPHKLRHGQTWVDPAADLMLDPFAGADGAFTDSPQEIPRPPAPRVLLRGFSGGVPDLGDDVNRHLDGELTSHDQPSFWTSVPYGPLTVLVQVIIPAEQSESLGYVQLFLDGKSLDNGTHLVHPRQSEFFDETSVRLTYTYNVPCPPTGRHLLQARYVKNDVWSEISPPLRFQVELPGTPKIVAVGAKSCAPMPIEHRRIVRVTTDTIVLKVAGVHPEARLMAIVDGEPVQCERVSNDCCYELRLTGLVEPGVHRIAVRNVSNNNCPITSHASKDIAVHYAPRHRYMVGLSECEERGEDPASPCLCRSPRPAGTETETNTETDTETFPEPFTPLPGEPIPPEFIFPGEEGEAVPIPQPAPVETRYGEPSSGEIPVWQPLELGTPDGDTASLWNLGSPGFPALRTAIRFVAYQDEQEANEDDEDDEDEREADVTPNSSDETEDNGEPETSPSRIAEQIRTANETALRLLDETVNLCHESEEARDRAANAVGPACEDYFIAQARADQVRETKRQVEEWYDETREVAQQAAKLAGQVQESADAARLYADQESRRADSAPLNDAKFAKAREATVAGHAAQAAALARQAAGKRDAAELARRKTREFLDTANQAAEAADECEAAAERAFKTADSLARDADEAVDKLHTAVNDARRAFAATILARISEDQKQAAEAMRRAQEAHKLAEGLNQAVQDAAKNALAGRASARSQAEKILDHQQDVEEAERHAEATYDEAVGVKGAIRPLIQPAKNATDRAGAIAKRERNAEQALTDALVRQDRARAEEREENTRKPGYIESKTIHFLSAAHFPLRDFGPNGEVFDREGLIIYEDMEFTYKETGHYDVTFTTGTPKIPVTLRLRFLFQKEEGGPWYTITLKPIRIDVDPKEEIDRTQPLQWIKPHHVTGHSQALVRTPGKICNLKRDGSATFGFGVTALSHHQSH